MKRTFTSKRANLPKYPYSQAIIYGDLIFVSAQPPIDPDTGEIDGESISEQTCRILVNISNLLIDAGTSLDQAIKVTTIIRDRSLIAEFNQAYGKFFVEDPPARTTIISDTGAYLVLLDVIAGLGQS